MHIRTPLAIVLTTGILLAPAARATDIARDTTPDIIIKEGRMILIYPTNGTFTVVEPGRVELLLVGGGGGGGTYESWAGCGGGGAGGVLTNAVTLAAGTYSVEVGAGGGIRQNGQNTILSLGGSPLFTAYGGGRGGARWNEGQGGNGGSGGGGAWGYHWPDDGVNNVGGSAIYGDSGNLGHSGGDSTQQVAAGGGGGAGEAGQTSRSYDPGRGGDGIEVPIIGSGDDFWYGGGGAAWRYWDTTPNSIRGGKGGGGSSGSTAGVGEDGKGGGGSGGAKGGSGIFILAYARSAATPNPGYLECTGGDVVLTNRLASDRYEVRVFRQSGTLTVDGEGTMEVLAVGGGGGGGKYADDWSGAAGGGAGGVVHYSNLQVAPGTYQIVIGAGGAVNANGSATKGLGITAFGGGAGAGGSWNGGSGKTGASGGGGSCTSANDNTRVGGTARYGDWANMGNNGGSSSSLYGVGGGGGASAPGADGTSDGYPGAGGDGYLCSITGTETYYGGGGAGWRVNTHQADGGLGGGGSSIGGAHAGEDGKGGGGSGTAAGGSGVFIVRYRVKPIATTIIVR